MEIEKEIKNNVDVGGKHSHGSNYTFPSFDLLKILHFSMPKIVVKSIPEGTKIEETYVFKILLEHFNKAYEIQLSHEDLLHSRSSFNAFIEFILNNILRRYLIINKECEDSFMTGIQKLRDTYATNLRSLEKYHDEIIRTIYRPQGLSKKDEKVRNDMYFFEQAYSLMKVAFKNEKRENGEKYFEHLKGVMEIIIRELPNPNINKILIALLHDVQEDIPEYADVVRRIYGDYIADAIEKLSKKDWKTYLTHEEKNICGEWIYEQKKLFDEVGQKLMKQHTDKSFTPINKIKESELIKAMDQEEGEKNKIIEQKLKPYIEKAKERRNKDYFGHLEQLNDDEVDVKFADRIHNLRDIEGLTEEKALRKIIETKKYFLDVAKKKNPKAYMLMLTEIKKIEILLEKGIE